MRKTKALLFLFLFQNLIQCTPQVFAETRGATPVPSEKALSLSEGFEQIERRKPASRKKLQNVCKDSKGTVIRQGEPGFEDCLSQSQTPLSQPSVTPEAPDDARKR